MNRRGFLLALLAGALAACASAARQEELMLTIRAYEGAVRWGMLDRAYEFMKPDPDNPVEPPAGLDQLRVTGYDQVSPVMPAGEKRYTLTAQIRYVHLDRQVERSLMDRQYWEYDDKAKRWWRTNPIPAFK